MIAALILTLTTMLMPPTSPAPREASLDGGAWREFPWVGRQSWRDRRGFVWCDDPHCPICGDTVYGRGWNEKPIRRGK